MTDKWYDSNNPTTVVRSGTWRAMIWVVCILAFVALIGFGTWAFKVLVSDVKGQGDATIQKNSGSNRIAAQERFESLYADIIAADQKIDVFAQAAKASPDDKTAQTNLFGTMAYCVQVRNDYNAEARKYSAEQFRSADLPYTIDINDPTTDCKEST
jgi:hypothetical protein